MLKHLIFLISFTILLGCNVQKSRFEIIEVKQIPVYSAYRVIDKINDKEIVLLSVKEEDCSINRNKIEVGKSYDFEIVEISTMLIEKDIYIQLGRNFSVDGFKLSENENYPYLIKNSCNGFFENF
jgi:hypothetical protein